MAKHGAECIENASHLMQVEGVRVYADQALYKEPHGGYTPWHCDAFYWPLASDKALTAWIPLQVLLWVAQYPGLACSQFHTHVVDPFLS